MATIHLLIKGRVQGVFFRVSAKEQADRLGVRGWVRNTSEGHVEIVASGDDNVLQQFIDWCRHGPPRAAVADLINTPHPERGFRDFSIA
jgi:acylphosphatase